MLIKRNIEYPDTLQTYSVNSDKFRMLGGYFFTKDDFSFTEEQFHDEAFWYENLLVNIFPAHEVTNLVLENEKNTLTKSLQDFSYKTKKGKYKERANFDWSLDYHKLFYEFNSQKLRVVLYSGNVLRGTKVGTDDIRGFSLSAFELEPIQQMTSGTQGNSELFLEYFDSNELNVNGYEVEVDFRPADIDRLFMIISLTFSEGKINVNLTCDGDPVTGVSRSEITIVDDISGDVSFGLAELGNGNYQLSNFDKNIKSACMKIVSSYYIGAKRFTFIYHVIITDNMLFEDDDNMIFEDDGDIINMIFEN